MLQAFVPMVELSRNGTPECLHLGALAVTDTEGRVLAQAGDPHWLCWSRSTLKPLQALPLVHSGGVQSLGLVSSELAVMCASHNGEDMHLAEVDSLLRKAGASHRQLRCGCHVPYRFATPEQPMPPGFAYDERHHNCSGKHSGFLAWCRLHGMPMDHYTDAGHPLQAAIRQGLAEIAGLKDTQLVAGVDGCSAPNYALPLSALARCFARLARPAADARYGESLQALGQAMSAHPELVSGTGRNDADFMRIGRGDWITKVGADGVQLVGSRSRGQALALKMMDGNKPALHAATVHALDLLGWLDADQRVALAPWRSESLRNVAGLEVGARRCIFNLQTC
jgi:L-asparaginase II